MILLCLTRLFPSRVPIGDSKPMPHRHPLSTNRYITPSSSSSFSTGSRGGRVTPRTTLTTPTMAASAATGSGRMSLSPLSPPSFASPFALRLSKYSSPHRWIRAPGDGVDVRVHVVDRSQDEHQDRATATGYVTERTDHHTTPPTFITGRSSSSIQQGHGSMIASSSSSSSSSASTSHSQQIPLQPEV